MQAVIKKNESGYHVEMVEETKAIRSESVQEILSSKPGFTDRWSLVFFLFIILLMLTATWFIKYPDIVQANAILTAANAPKEIITRTDGKLIKLFVTNDQHVIKNDVIAWIDGIARHSQVLELNHLLDSSIILLSKNRTDDVSKLFDKPFRQLGELQTNYQQFITAWQLFDDYLVNGYYFKRKKVLEEDLRFLQQIHLITEEEQHLTQEDADLSQEAFDSNDTLFKYKIISKQDLRDQKSKLVAKKLNTSQLKSTLVNNENQQSDKVKDILELEHSISQQKTVFAQSIETMKSLTDDWIKKYVITAPEDGKVVYIMPIQENQYLTASKILGYINPPDSRYYAQVNLPQNNFGKLKIGEKVQLRFDAYPYQEFGSVVGTLAYISKVPSDSGFLATIELTSGLTTNNRHEIQYKSGLKAQAMIVTKESRLLQRFYYTFVKEMQR